MVKNVYIESNTETIDYSVLPARGSCGNIAVEEVPVDSCCCLTADSKDAADLTARNSKFAGMLPLEAALLT